MTNHSFVRDEVENLHVSTVIRQLVCFRLGEEEFGINIDSVHEIIKMITVTHIPQAPDFVEGIINLRGNITPVVDLRQRFGFPALEKREKESRIILIEARSRVVGLIVDAVTEVISLPHEKLDDPFEISNSDIDTHYIEGVSMVGEKLLIILEAEKIFTEEEIHFANMPHRLKQ